tara:strand:- start:632 stop:1012 length:381 start_codon:yes stop_codon:yes gene_type:complete
MKIIFLLLFSVSTSLFARGPAVEPVSGISIEEYNETTPKEGRGFDFSSDNTYYEKMPADTNLSATSIIFLVFASALPFFVWFGIMRALPDGSPVNQASTSTRPSLTVVSDDQSPTDSDDQHWPKAS